MDEVPEIRRQEFLSALDETVAAARSHGVHMGLLLIDLTNLSRINHSHGYATGDELLSGTYRYLLDVSTAQNSVFRVGCHRFALILPRLSSPSFIALALNKVTGLLQRELFGDVGMVSPKLKIGVALNSGGKRETLDMLAMAESSVAHVRPGASHQLEDLVRQDQEELQDSRLELLFAEALRDNDFDLCYQPQVELQTGRIVNAEALLRWTTRDGKVVSPESVIGLAESMGRSFELTKWVIHKAMRQLKQWQAQFDIGVALNVQASLVGDPEWPSLLLDAISIWGVDSDRVTVEITEDAIIEDKEAGYNNLLRLKERGVKMSIDDFGTGYSSLSYFKHIPAGELKIDKAFVQAMNASQEDMELVKVMIHIAHQFGLQVIAEGVEEEGDMRQLRELGCDLAQGYYFAPPLTVDDFEALLVDWQG
ncbi:MAG: putative bifunctional diguanylate cyclase/phosphodiesterase, partial [Halioglobus sp.]